MAWLSCESACVPPSFPSEFQLLNSIYLSASALSVRVNECVGLRAGVLPEQAKITISIMIPVNLNSLPPLPVLQQIFPPVLPFGPFVPSAPVSLSHSNHCSSIRQTWMSEVMNASLSSDPLVVIPLSTPLSLPPNKRHSLIAAPNQRNNCLLVTRLGFRPGLWLVVCSGSS